MNLKKKIDLRITKPTRVEASLDDLTLVGGYLAIEESLSRSVGSIIVPDAANAKIGTVVRTDPTFEFREGQQVLYTEWQGGRWMFLNPDSMDGVSRVLIMHSDYVLALIDEG